MITMILALIFNCIILIGLLLQHLIISAIGFVCVLILIVWAEKTDNWGLNPSDPEWHDNWFRKKEK